MTYLKYLVSETFLWASCKTVNNSFSFKHICYYLCYWWLGNESRYCIAFTGVLITAKQKVGGAILVSGASGAYKIKQRCHRRRRNNVGSHYLGTGIGGSRGGGGFGARDGAPTWGSKLFQFHAVFAKIGKIVCWRPLWGWRPHLGEILDPPLTGTMGGHRPTRHWVPSLIQLFAH